MSNPVNDQTKPSRIQRKRKRRWKASTIADLLKWGLTDCYRVVTLTLSCKCRAGLGISEIHGASRLQCGIFMRKISALHFMSGWVGSRKAGRVVCPVFQPAQSGAMFGIVSSGLKPFTHGTQS